MAKISLSNQHSTFENIEKYYEYNENSLRLYFSENNSYFTGYSRKELENELNECLMSLDKMCSLELLSMLEARFRIDYILRCRARKKDLLSKKFREIEKNLANQKKQNRIRLIEDILVSWKEVYPEYKKILNELEKAFDYRNWLAHGRYWEPVKKPHIVKYDYLGIFLISKEVIKNIEFIE